MAELISVIVSTYNREDALDAVLRSLSRQTDRGFEVVVADDGSGPATARVVDRVDGAHAGAAAACLARATAAFALAEIRNRAIRGERRRLLHLPRRRLHRAAGFRRRPSPARRARLVRHRQPHPAVARVDRAHAARRARARAAGASPAGWRSARSGGVNRLAPLLRPAARAAAQARPRRWQGARGATWRSGAPISTGSTASMRRSAAGAARIPTSSSG